VKLNQSVQAWVVAITSGLFFFYMVIQWTMFNALSSALMIHFSVSSSAISRLSAVYFYVNIICLFPAGMLLDRFSTYRVVLIAMAVAIVGTVGTLYVDTLAGAEWCRVLVGAAGSFCLVSVVRLVSRWFPARSLALVIGVVVMLAMMGGVVAQTPFTLLTDACGWRAAIYADVVLGLVITALIAMFVRDRPSRPIEGVLCHPASLPFLKAIRLTVTNRQNWFAGLYTSFMNLPVMVFSFWGSFYLIQSWHMSRLASSWIDTCLLLGAIVGSPALGWVSDRLGKRRLPMMVSAVVLGCLTVLLYVAHALSMPALAVIFGAIGFFSSAQVMGYPLIAESNPSDLIATAEGFSSILIMAGGLSQQVFGYLLDHVGSHVVEHHITHYSNVSYHAALLMFPVACVLSWLVAFLAKEGFATNT